MVEKIYTDPEIYRIRVDLKGNALKNLNSYVIHSGEEWLVIDTGFNREDCKESFLEGLNELGISPERTSLFLTHLHSDHIGLTELFCPKKEKQTSHIYIGKTDYQYLDYIKNGNYAMEIDELYLREGFPKNELEEQKKDNPAQNYSTKGTFPAILLEHGDHFEIGDIELECIEVSGHTPGHMCLYIRNQQILFLGDHVLYDITPNVMGWPGIPDSLGRYLDNLMKIKQYPVKLALPAHRGGNEKPLGDRIDELLSHHDERLEEIMQILKKNGKMTAYHVASKMRWSLHGATWDTAPKQQKWFAVGEARAHLLHLLTLGRISEEKTENRNRYYIP